MEKYFGESTGKEASPLVDGMITNRADLTTGFYYDRKVRRYRPEKSPTEFLEQLGYNE